MAPANNAPPRSFHFEPLTPTAYLDRSAEVFADRPAVIDGDDQWTYAQLRDRCLRLAGGLAGLGIEPGDRVAVLAPNSHQLLESHYAMPYAGAVLVALNFRLAAAELAYIVEHSGARLLIYHPDLTDLAHDIVGRSDGALMLLDGGAEYELLATTGAPLQVPVDDEQGLICLNYTSGTTGRPKGVMYHHRGAYLQSLAMVAHFKLSSDSKYLWTLPMFHCNGWCFTWAITAAGATHVCVPQVVPEQIWTLLDRHSITHFCAAPTVLMSLVNAPSARAQDRDVVVAVGGAPPTPSLLARSAGFGLHVTHLYGLTETFGPVVICDWRSEWDALTVEEQAVRRARQGVANTISCSARIVDAKGIDVPRDGSTLGEIALRGNNIMLGYYRDDEATAVAVPDGWLRTGDLGVLHPDGYLEIRDRAKDVIISGGENISSIEVEAALASHPAVLEAAVVAVPNEKWGERPAALVTLREGATVSVDELKAHLRERIAGFKVPDQFRFGPLPKTATGKIQKFRVRDTDWLADSS